MLESTQDERSDRLSATQSEDVCGGRIAACYQQGLTPEEIRDQYAHVSLAQVYAALAYYHVNRDEIERDLDSESADFLRLSKYLSEA